MNEITQSPNNIHRTLEKKGLRNGYFSTSVLGVYPIQCSWWRSSSSWSCRLGHCGLCGTKQFHYVTKDTLHNNHEERWWRWRQFYNVKNGFFLFSVYFSVSFDFIFVKPRFHCVHFFNCWNLLHLSSRFVVDHYQNLKFLWAFTNFFGVVHLLIVLFVIQ